MRTGLVLLSNLARGVRVLLRCFNAETAETAEITKITEITEKTYSIPSAISALRPAKGKAPKNFAQPNPRYV